MGAFVEVEFADGKEPVGNEPLRRAMGVRAVEVTSSPSPMQAPDPKYASNEDLATEWKSETGLEVGLSTE